MIDRNHCAIFSRDDGSYKAVADFFSPALHAGQPLFFIATPEHQEAFRRELTISGSDVENLLRTGHLKFVDARATLSTFMVESVPDPRLFKSTIHTLVETTHPACKAVTTLAYGEMVDPLRRDGNSEGALQLEVLWNEFAADHNCFLLCGYTMNTFTSVDNGIGLKMICDQHTGVIGTGGSRKFFAVHGGTIQPDVPRDPIAQLCAVRFSSEFSRLYNEQGVGQAIAGVDL